MSYWLFLSCSASDSITQHSLYDFVRPQILGHTLRYSLYVQLWGEVSASIPFVIWRWDEISRQMKIHSAIILAAEAQELWIRVVKPWLRLCFFVYCKHMQHLRAVDRLIVCGLEMKISRWGMVMFTGCDLLLSLLLSHCQTQCAQVILGYFRKITLKHLSHIFACSSA